MDTKTLKSGFWGYSKTSVCEYIARINEEFSRKLMDTFAEQEKTQKELREKLAQLERENARLRNSREDVAAALLDAKAYAARLNQQAEADNRKLQEENAACRDAETARIQTYRKSIDIIRNEIRRLFENMDMELKQSAEQLSVLEEGGLAHVSEILNKTESAKDSTGA